MPCTEESSAADQSVPDEDHDTLDSSPPDVDSTTASQDTVEESTEMDGDQGEEPIEENSETEQVWISWICVFSVTCREYIHE